MKTCPQGHPFEPGRLEIGCPFCVAVRRSRIVKAVVFTTATVAVLVHSSAPRTDLVSVLLWVPAWVGVALATLGNRHLFPWAAWTYLIGGLVLRSPAGYRLWQPILDLLQWLALPSDVATASGWLLLGSIQGLMLGLLGVSLDVLLRRFTNEPTPF